MKDTIYITMDMDWANDGVLADTITLVEKLDIPVCLFITNDTPLISVLRNHPLFTLGIHPNFMPQMNGQTRKSYLETLRELHAIVPESKIIRCHSLIDATPILTAAKEMGFLADMNLFIPFSSGIKLAPFTHFSGLKRLPFFYEDDAWTLEAGASSPEEHLKTEGLAIFNFHPIHLYLNTEKMDRYFRAKPYYHDFAALAAFVNHGPEFGARDFLVQLKEASQKSKTRFGKVSELWE